jgi:hypothetical protein
MTQSFAAVAILMTVGTDHGGGGSEGEDTHSSGACESADRGDKPFQGGHKAHSLSLSQPGAEVYDVDVDLVWRITDTSTHRNVKSERDSAREREREREKEIVKSISSEKKIDDIPSPRGAGYFMAASSTHSQSQSQYIGTIPSEDAISVPSSMSLPAMIAAGVIASSSSPSPSSSSEYPRNKGDVLLNFEDKVAQCESHLVSFALSVDRLKALIVKDLTNLSLVMHEPELWQRFVKTARFSVSHFMENC